jgi:hypothetical protein
LKSDRSALDGRQKNVRILDNVSQNRPTILAFERRTNNDVLLGLKFLNLCKFTYKTHRISISKSDFNLIPDAWFHTAKMNVKHETDLVTLAEGLVARNALHIVNFLLNGLVLAFLLGCLAFFLVKFSFASQFNQSFQLSWTLGLKRKNAK